ncbi:hypothetical protein CONPUDRAFT_152396 [Coniophora puteana RWD-64-598 SS2]|uniref:Uncharacterized protein n=1 Tax=Coniophora puteana (strain RWD-64-598) TaxID=741705 RepID=A0A5M3MXA5_CONPW|nr:uncharacterized protein CONPUDRAFT_152396 [Coniophora puteana RWD-64-598 SS2]EIW83365.1 hypothetical protein CONPUDRAFT_152396 [Coniophora puteana RWD-64-598 SS2]
MPLFSAYHEEPPRTSNTFDQPPQRSRSIFSRNRSNSPPASNRSSVTNGSSTRNGGLFGSLRSRSSDSSIEQTKRNMSRDPTIAAARMKVADAEAAERAADKALVEARSAVKSAREHIKVLENEVLEDARRAKAKQAEAKNVSKSAKGLGRHG